MIDGINPNARLINDRIEITQRQSTTVNLRLPRT